MNDPHVESLTYRIEAKPEVVSFENPPPLVHETEAFRLRLEGGVLTVELKEHYMTAPEARARVEGYLRDWSLFSALDFDSIPMDFTFENTLLIDRNPSPQVPGRVTGEVHVVSGPVTIQAYGTVTPPVRKEYPKPPSVFRSSPDVETMWFRYRQHVEGKEPLASMGYFCLSVLQWSTGAKDATSVASQMFNIDKEVLDKLGNLTSLRGTPLEARAFKRRATLSAFTDAERRWVRQTVKRLILRKGEYDYDSSNGASLPQISMADLPQL
jgi:hypothetical protein